MRFNKTLASILIGLGLFSSSQESEAKAQPKSLYQVFQSRIPKEKKIFQYVITKGSCDEKEGVMEDKKTRECSLEFTSKGKNYQLSAFPKKNRLEFQIKDIVKDMDNKKTRWTSIGIIDYNADGLKKNDSVDVEVFQGLKLVSKNDWVQVMYPTAAEIYTRNIDKVGQYLTEQLNKELQTVKAACGLEQKVEQKTGTPKQVIPDHEVVLRKKLGLAKQEGYSRNFAESVL
ncbi:MAG: hypothetical protein ABIA37_03515, partial [Candidatus Woesearchaeota archaeon]